MLIYSSTTASFVPIFCPFWFEIDNGNEVKDVKRVLTLIALILNNEAVSGVIKKTKY
ncbi:hypothetical protein [Candidatus Nitrosocosmicus sp. SS]|uniref:hypothetical protein n=1 Tax=Candidatus Nitrosocosmicus agrestis TaxID=2563600 RepID=UPI0012B6313C|nr:hypothetical protein [Candidatus Nitrosocosmicus sp. SS]